VASICPLIYNSLPPPPLFGPTLNTKLSSLYEPLAFFPESPVPYAPFHINIPSVGENFQEKLFVFTFEDTVLSPIASLHAVNTFPRSSFALEIINLSVFLSSGPSTLIRRLFNYSFSTLLVILIVAQANPEVFSSEIGNLALVSSPSHLSPLVFTSSPQFQGIPVPPLPHSITKNG
jgi:hypothetical protein